MENKLSRRMRESAFKQFYQQRSYLTIARYCLFLHLFRLSLASSCNAINFIN